MKISIKNILLNFMSLASCIIIMIPIIIFIIFKINIYIKNNTERVVNIYRCPNPVQRKAEFTINGIAFNGSEYTYGFSLRQEELPGNILKLYPDIFTSVDSVKPHSLILNIPLDEFKKPLLVLNGNFYMSMSKEQLKTMPIYNGPFSGFHKYTIYGYEYQAKTSKNRTIRLPFFDILGWSYDDNNINKHAIDQLFKMNKNIIFIENIDEKTNIPEWVVEAPWEIPENQACYN